MQVHADFFKQTGKWYASWTGEIEPQPHEDGVLEAVVKNQDVVISLYGFYVVLDDIPESKADPNYRTTYSRLYTPAEVNQATNPKGRNS